MPLYMIEKHLVDLVWADDEQEAWEIFRRHQSEVYEDDQSIVEIKTLGQLRNTCLGGDSMAWGSREECVRDLLAEEERRLWEKRRPVFVITEEHVDSELADHVPGAPVHYIESGDIGRVVYRLPERRLVLEDDDQRLRRREDGTTDLEVRIKIEQRRFEKMAADIGRQAELLSELGRRTGDA